MGGVQGNVWLFLGSFVAAPSVCHTQTISKFCCVREDAIQCHKEEFYCGYIIVVIRKYQVEFNTQGVVVVETQVYKEKNP